MSSGTYLDGALGGPDGGHVRHGGDDEVGVGVDVGEGGGLLGGVELVGWRGLAGEAIDAWF